MSDKNASPNGTGNEPVRPPRDSLYRTIDTPAVVEFRAAEEVDDLGDGFIGLLRGEFLVFNQWTEINSLFEGNFMERFAAGSTKKTINESRDQMRVLFQHGRDPMAGDKPLGPIRDIRETDTGTYYEVPLLDTSYNRDLLPGLRSGLYGASHRFRVMREDINDEPGATVDNPKGLPERTIKEAQIMEFGPVTFPAYKGASAGVRSITDAIIFGDFARDPDALHHLVETWTQIRSHEAARAATNDEATTSTTAEVAETTNTNPVEDAAPPQDRAEQPAHPARGRRDSRPLYGLHRKGQAWRL